MGEGPSFNPEQDSTGEREPEVNEQSHETEEWPSIRDLRPGDPIEIAPSKLPSPFSPGVELDSMEEPSPFRVPDNPKSREKLGQPRPKENGIEGAGSPD